MNLSDISRAIFEFGRSDEDKVYHRLIHATATGDIEWKEIDGTAGSFETHWKDNRFVFTGRALGVFGPTNGTSFTILTKKYQLIERLGNLILDQVSPKVNDSQITNDVKAAFIGDLLK